MDTCIESFTGSADQVSTPLHVERTTATVALLDDALFCYCFNKAKGYFAFHCRIILYPIMRQS